MLFELSSVSVILFVLGFANSSERISYKRTEIVNTSLGPVRGKTQQTITGKLVDVFLGIPYAEPPLGQLRFKHPRPAKPWNGIFEAATIPRDCQQIKLPTSLNFMSEFVNLPPFDEDCLKLSIWRPKRMENGPKRPVVVFIAPGAFAVGGMNAPFLDGSIFSTEEDLIFVAFNYRVASLGFLYLDHPEVPGNAGLLDQVMALQWVKSNIGNFGGDPEQITLMGQSAGAASVIYHLLSPLSKGLFKRAIAESGAPHRTYAYLEKEVSLERTATLAEYLGCPTGLENKTDLIRCLREADAADLIANEPRPAGVDLDIFVFSPVTDGYFFPKSPFTMLKGGAINDGELLLGSNKDEGSLFLLVLNPYIYSPFKITAPISVEDFAYTVRGKASFNSDVTELLVATYFQPEMSLESNLTAVIRVISDYVFHCPIKEVELAIAASKRTMYKYYFPYRSVYSRMPKWLGSHHSEELHYTIGYALNHPNDFTEEEKEFSRRLMRYWGNFVRTGNPNNRKDLLEEDIYWPKFTLGTQEYLVLAPNSTSVGRFFRHKTCYLMTNIISRIEKNARKGRTCFT